MFRTEIATAAACYFLEKAPNQTLNDLVLMKLMVITERQFMERTTSLLTGAHFASMQNGPVLSEMLNLMKGDIESPLWRDHVLFIPYAGKGTESNRCVLTRRLPVDEFLTEYETSILASVWKDYGHRSKWKIVDITHTFPEWDRSCAESKSSKPITLESIYRLSMDESPEDAKMRADEIAFFESVSGRDSMALTSERFADTAHMG